MNLRFTLNQPYSFFGLTHFIIKAPCEGYTAPCSRGVLFVSDKPLRSQELELLDDFTYEEYSEWKNQRSCARKSILERLPPVTYFELSPLSSYTFEQSFRTPVYGKYACVKLISADNLFCGYRNGLLHNNSNIDLQYVGFRGFIGKHCEPYGNLC